MDKNNSVRNSLIAAIVIMVVTASFFTVMYVRTKKSLENFYAVLGKDEKTGFSQVVQSMMNDSKFGTAEENIRYAALAPTKGVVEIGEKMFATQVSDVYLNAEDYLGKTIKLEGIFKKEQYHVWDEPYCFVVRYGPGGCCGLDANVGFEVKWPKGGRTQPYPAEDSWVEASGELKVDEDGYYLYLDLASLNVLSRRGAEFVLQ